MEDTSPFTREEFTAIIEGVSKLPFQQRKQAKQALERVMHNYIRARMEKVEKSIERSRKHFRKHTAHRPCVCADCGETKTYAEMWVFDVRKPNDENNQCRDCGIREVELEDRLLALEEDEDY